MLLAVASLTGCAATSETRLSWDSLGGSTAQDSSTYLSCVDGRLTPGTATFVSESGTTRQLLTGSADPLRASGIVQITPIAGGNHFSAYQRSAWQDKGELLDAAYQCAQHS
ncbi:hypothetical protein CEG18_10000 [Pseudomonas nitroreducens]|uniref:Uncharacterized protein n=1 Tax=Pseudomonas nitroreducens TaxID=46680 RepID=A0A246FB27_PSENT|nr:hypothetical protein CEG18_10000 [Pseudomonas nitroreducens]